MAEQDQAQLGNPAQPGIPDVDPATFVKAKAALKIAKANFTRKFNSGNRLVARSREVPSLTIAEQLDVLRQDMHVAYTDLCSSLDNISLLCGDDQLMNTYERCKNDTQSKFDDIVDDILTAQHNIRNPQAPNPPAAPQAHQSDQPRPNLALQPSLLSLTQTPTELRAWKRKYKTYYTSSKFHLAPIEEQHEYFRSCLADTLDNKIFGHVEPDTPIFSNDTSFKSCFSILDEIWLQEYPLFNRRLTYFRIQQPQGERFSGFAPKLHAVGLEADLPRLSVNELELFRYISSCSDEKLREKFQNCSEPSLANFERIFKAHESSESQQRALADGVAVVADRGRTSRRFAPSPRYGSQPQQRVTGKVTLDDLRGKCFRCGSSSHRLQACTLPSFTKCYNCNKEGHLSKVCLGGNQRRSPSRPRMTSRRSSPVRTLGEDNLPNEDESEIKCAAIATSTPRLAIGINQDATTFHVNALPDTGAARSVMADDIATSLGLKIDKNTSGFRLLAANDTPLRSKGTATFEVCNKVNGKKTIVTAVITPDISEDVIIGWKDLINLGVIDNRFPHRINVIQSGSQDNACMPMNQLVQMRDDILNTHSSVFKDSLEHEVMQGSPMHIHLDAEKATPFRVLKSRPIPLNWQALADKEIERMLRGNILAKVEEPTDWLSPSFFVQKPNGKLRLVTDFSKLNAAVMRPIHQFPSSHHIISSIHPTSRVFAKLDCVSGYHQIPLDYESSLLTTMLLPSGRYRYIRSPMGLNASSDEFCRRTDDVLSGIPGTLKLVDDILIFAPTMADLRDRIEQVITKCSAANIILSKEKFEIGSKVTFAGFVISCDGITPDPKKTAAIKNFPTPKNVSDVRSFLGLANQLAIFEPDLASISYPLRVLLSKDTVFQWLPDHDDAFSATKSILCSPKIVKFFDNKLQTVLLTDASKLNGIGFALVQFDNNEKIRLIQCGSRSLSATEKNYSVIETELLAITWALDKARHFLMGHIGFKIITDHRPLLGLFDKPLQDISNSRLQRLRMKTIDYSFVLEWCEGKLHKIADALSRYPVSQPTALNPNNDISNIPILSIAGATSNNLIVAAGKDSTYQLILEALQKKTKPMHLHPSHPARTLKPMWSTLSIDSGLIIVDGSRILVPTSAVPLILSKLHTSHPGIQRMKSTARGLYYWKTMNADIERTVNECDKCQRLRPSQQQPSIVSVTASSPMEDLSTDLFSLCGKNYLVVVDRYSGFPWAFKLSSTSTDAVWSCLKRIFFEHGYPRKIMSDNGPQFRGKFKELCVEKSIQHRTSSPYNPSSNGLAESAVKRISHLLKKNDHNFEKFEESLLELRATASSNGDIPATKFFSRNIITSMPQVISSSQSNFPPIIRTSKYVADTATEIQSRLRIGQRVRVQDEKTKEWCHQGVISASSPSGLSFHVDLDKGQTIWRNHRFIKPLAKSVTFNLNNKVVYFTSDG